MDRTIGVELDESALAKLPWETSRKGYPLIFDATTGAPALGTVKQSVIDAAITSNLQAAASASSIIQADTVAALTALTPVTGQVAIVLGHTAANDGGGGTWRFKSGDQSAHIHGAALSVSAIDAGTDEATISGHGLRPGHLVEATVTEIGLSSGSQYYVGLPTNSADDANKVRFYSSWLDAMKATDPIGLSGSPTTITIKKVLDKRQGRHAAPDSDTTGASGVWERVETDGKVSSLQFGSGYGAESDVAARTASSQEAIQCGWDWADDNRRHEYEIAPGFHGVDQLCARAGVSPRSGAPNAFLLSEGIDSTVLVHRTAAFGDDVVIYDTYENGLERAGSMVWENIGILCANSAAQSVGHGLSFRSPIRPGTTRTTAALHAILIGKVEVNRMTVRGAPESGLYLKGGASAPIRLQTCLFEFNGAYGYHLDDCSNLQEVTIESCTGDGNTGGALGKISGGGNNAGIRIVSGFHEKRSDSPVTYGFTGAEDGAGPYGVEIGSMHNNSAIIIEGFNIHSANSTYPLALVRYVGSTTQKPKIFMTAVRIDAASGKTDSPTHAQRILSDESSDADHILAGYRRAVWPTLEEGVREGHTDALAELTWRTSNATRFINRFTEGDLDHEEEFVGYGVVRRTTAAAGSDWPLRNNFTGMVTVGAAVELTIASGVVTVTRTRHSIDTEADAASDNLVTLNGGVEGMILIIHPAADSRAIVIEHGTGANGIDTGPAGSDITLANRSECALLIFNATTAIWSVLCHNGT